MLEAKARSLQRIINMLKNRKGKVNTLPTLVKDLLIKYQHSKCVSKLLE